MKYSLLFFVLLFSSYVVVAQTSSSNQSPLIKFLYKRGYRFPDSTSKNIPDSLKKWPDTLYYNTVYKSALLGSPTIPIPVSSVEYINGQYSVSPTISLGYGYTWFFGDFIFNENDKITVDPIFFFGIIGDAGLENNLSFRKITGFTGDLFIGLGPLSLFGGYDFINHSASIGLGARLDLYTIFPNSLNPIGKVRPVRKPKKIAPPITLE